MSPQTKESVHRRIYWQMGLVRKEPRMKQTRPEAPTQIGANRTESQKQA
jgi:hypothetical protein